MTTRSDCVTLFALTALVGALCALALAISPTPASAAFLAVVATICCACRAIIAGSSA